MLRRVAGSERRGHALRKAGMAGGAFLAALFASEAAQAQCAFTPGQFQLNGFGERVFTFTDGVATGISSSVMTMNTAFQTQTSAFISSPRGTEPNQFTGGVWIRGIGGRMDVTSTSSGAIGIVDAAGADLGPGSAGSFSCNTVARNDFAGFQGGVDIGRLSFGDSGWNVHWGVTGGFLGSETRSARGVLARSDVPFVGVYAALTGPSGFFIDAQVRRDFYDIKISDPSAGVNGAQVDANGWGVIASAGYNFSMGSYFIEPSVGVAYSRTKVDPLLVLGGFDAGPAFAVAAQVRPIESLLGRAGVRVGTSFVAGGVAVQPFVAASVWHEFAGHSITEAASSGGVDIIYSRMETSRVGTFGQYSLGIAASLLDTGWLGYARIDYRNGRNLEGLSVNGGLRYQFAPDPRANPTSAYAMSEGPAVAAGPTSWSGLYVGGFVGGAWSAGNVTSTEAAPDPGTFASYNGLGTNTSFGLGSSVTGGLTLGYNHQMGAFVAGIEAEGGYMRLRGAAPFPFFSGDTVASSKVGDWYAMLAGRFGFSFGQALVYAKGGGVLLSVTSNVVDTCASGGCGGAIVNAYGGNSVGLSWAIGGGLEYALGSNWSVKGEYMYLGTQHTHRVSGPGFVPAIAPDVQTFNWEHRIPGIHTAKLGINYRFSAPPPVVVSAAY